MSAPVQRVVHTPGPWRTARGFSTSPPIALPVLVVQGQGKDCRTLAVVVPNGKETDEDLANAAIMSRSPQMVELLEAALDELVALQCRVDDVIVAEPKINGVALAIEHLLDDMKVK